MVLGHEPELIGAARRGDLFVQLTRGYLVGIIELIIMIYRKKPSSPRRTRADIASRNFQQQRHFDEAFRVALYRGILK